jgi:hypothetical protein
MSDNTLPAVSPAKTLPVETDENSKIVQSLVGYWQEADNNRRSGLNPRDDKWSQNLDLYWNRHDFSRKAAWQAKEIMPEVPSFVDRFAAALKEALVATPTGFYDVVDPYDQENDLASAIKRMEDVWLSTIGVSQTGGHLSFPAVFEEQMKLGALMACCGVVTWRDGRVALDAVDPRNVWLDHTGRNLYRIRRVALDLIDLQDMMGQKDSKGMPLFNPEGIMGMVEDVRLNAQAEAEALTGTGQQVMSTRHPIVLDEYRATVIGMDGKPLARDGLFVVGNNKFLIRGPEKNPFWHDKDWLVYAPLVTAPLSVYGRSYMEDFGTLAVTFTELTNLILDAVHTSAINAYTMVPSMLMNPEQATEGISPGKVFLLGDGYDPKQFATKLELGTLDQGAFQVWQAIKSELTEAAGINEIGMGQFAPNSRTSATEISATQQSSSALVRSVAQTVETRFLDPVLDLIWKTGVQHARLDDQRLAAACGENLYPVIMGRRKQLLAHPTTFQARGISTMIQNSQTLQKVLALMQIIGASEPLMAAFMQVIDPGKLLSYLMRLNNIDVTKMQPSMREQMVRGLTEQVQPSAQPTQPGLQAMGGLAQTMGIAAG